MALTKHNQVYDPANPHLGGNGPGCNSWTFYPEMWKWMVTRFAVKSVLDVGCGEGYSLEEFSKLGCHAIGLEGLEINARLCHQPVIIHDLIKSSLILTGIDLVWCCEVVEHVEEKFLNNLLETITASRVLAMTHATPGQKGYHHVNCQDDAYWIGKIEPYGFKFDGKTTQESKLLARDHWTKSGMIFVRHSV